MYWSIFPGVATEKEVPLLLIAGKSNLSFLAMMDMFERREL
jgi:hypothetical protein